MLRKSLLNHGWLVFHDPAGYTGLPLWFKGFLIFGIAVIAGVLAYYTQQVVGQLKIAERRMANNYAEQWRKAVESQSEAVTGFLFEQIIQKRSFPLVVTDADNNPMHWRELEGVVDSDSSRTPRDIERVREIVTAMDEHYPPVPIVYQGQVLHYIHYGNYRLIRNLSLLPFLEVGLVVLFLLIAYIGFRNLKRAEQRYIWVGMAKETAHQLGTPLSSLLGWLEIFRDKSRQGKITMQAEQGSGFDDIIERMLSDTRRLEQVANRFGLIGSEPTKTTVDLRDIVCSTVDYFRARMPFRGKGAAIVADCDRPITTKANAELMGWVLENLIKNALEAVDPRTGRITVALEENRPRGVAVIRVTDNGRGVPTAMQKKIFSPGYTSKKRGWGLGLTLSRRIVAEYHAGRIYLARSIPGEQTEFVVELPLIDPAGDGPADKTTANQTEETVVP